MTFDRFHVMKLLSEAVDDVRRVEQRDNPLLKKTRYIWLKNETNLTAKQRGDEGLADSSVDASGHSACTALA